MQAFEKYEKAIEIKPDVHEAFNNWGISLGRLAGTKEGKAAEALYKEAIEKYKKAIENGGSSYNLSCIYALKGEKENALHYLNMSLSNREIDVDFVNKDEDWEAYWDDVEFIALINKYKK
ncbi:MAG TPA: hypothetical protein ENJ82_07195 [Bacteroidetes bacterium]|nr:hypothetical protein [Bacteroidota bacterium]